MSLIKKTPNWVLHIGKTQNRENALPSIVVLRKDLCDLVSLKGALLKVLKRSSLEHPLACARFSYRMSSGSPTLAILSGLFRMSR